MGYLLDDIADWLTSGGIATPIYTALLPERPDEAIQVLRTGGLEPVRAFRASPGQPVEERPTVQIVRRSTSQKRAVVEMEQIFKLLDGAGDVTKGGTRYYWIAARQPPFPIGRDETDRWLVGMNFDVARAVSTATST